MDPRSLSQYQLILQSWEPQNMTAKEIRQYIFLAGKLKKTVHNNTKSDKVTKTSPLSSNIE